MTSVGVCGECKGKGQYKIRNAYDPTFVEEILCEYCDGTGVLYELEGKSTPGDSEDDTWLN